MATSSLFEGPSRPQITVSGGAVCTVAGPTVTCLWTTLPAAATGTASIAVPWRSAIGKVCDTVTVSAGTIDPSATNNTSSACIGKK